MRRGHGARYDLPVPGYKANLSDVLASIALVQLDKLERHAAVRRRQFELYDEAVERLDGVTPVARDPRDTHAPPPLHGPDRPRASGRDARRLHGARSPRSGSRPRSTSCPCTGCAGTAERFPDQPPLPVAERAGDELLSLPLSPAHSEDDILDASPRSSASTTFTA